MESQRNTILLDKFKDAIHILEQNTKLLKKHQILKDLLGILAKATENPDECERNLEEIVRQVDLLLSGNVNKKIYHLLNGCRTCE